MTDGKMDRLLNALRTRLIRDSSFGDETVTCEIQFFVKCGGLAGDVIVTKRLKAPGAESESSYTRS